jgi:hypothetical protein
MIRSTMVVAAGLALAATLPAVPAQAQAPRTFVSAAGSDSNPCSFAAPCRHFQAAVNATSAGGEVDALDPAGYGPIIISQAVTIEGQGWSYIAPPAGGNGITINAVSGTVAIHGVSLNGVGIAMTVGIEFISGGSLNVQDSVVRNFSVNGISFQPNTSSPSQIYVSNTLVSDNSGQGIIIEPAGTGTTNGVLDHVKMQNNGAGGLDVFTASQTISVTVSDSVSANNSLHGINALWIGGLGINIMVRSSSITNNANDGLLATGSHAQIWVTRSSITGNAFGVVISNGNVTTYNDNNIVGNAQGNGAPSSLPYN